MDVDRTPAPALAESVAELLGAIDMSRMSDDDLRELLIQSERASRQLRAVQADAMITMVERTRREAVPHPHRTHGNAPPEEFVVDEVAVLLTCTRAAANIRLSTAWQASRYPALRTRWRVGALDESKVRVIADGVAPLTAQHADLPQLVDDSVVQALVEAAADYAITHTTGQIRQWLNRRVVTVDPCAADIRRQRAMAERRVVVTPGADGMSELWALLPSIEARHIQQVLGRVAHDAPRGDSRTPDQRRADALCDLVAGTVTPPRVETSLMLTGRFDGDGQIQLDDTGELAGVGTITRSQLVELLGGSTERGSAPSTTAPRPRLLPCDAATGSLVVNPDGIDGYRPSGQLDRQVRSRDLTCRFPGCRRAAVGTAHGVDLDHTIPWPAGDTDASNLACLCRRHHRLKHQGSWSVTQTDGQLTWTTPTGRTVTTRPWQYTEPSRAP